MKKYVTNRIELVSILLLVFYISLISVPTAFSKKCQKAPSYELITNGNFESGNTGFNSDYLSSPFNMKGCATYTVGKNPQVHYYRFTNCSDHTNGSGNMLIANGDTTFKIIWSETLRNLKKNTDYELSFWILSVDTLYPAILIAMINGDTLNPQPIYFPYDTCRWVNVKYIWNSGSRDTAEIKFVDVNIHYFGNDFAIDDISFMQNCRLQACAGDDISTCKSTNVQIDADTIDGAPPYTFEWTPAIGLSNPNTLKPIVNIAGSTMYHLKITDGKGCVSTDSVMVNIYNEPPGNLTVTPAQPSCPCDATTITAPAGFSYLWSNNEKTQSITTQKEGTYKVTITDANGCSIDAQTTITHKKVEATIEAGTVDSKTGQNVTIPIKVSTENNLINCGYNDFSGSINFNSTILLPNGTTPIGSILNGTETIPFSGQLSGLELFNPTFTSVLGNSICTDIVLSNFKNVCDSVVISLKSGKFCLLDVCKAGGDRLIDLSKTGGILINNTSSEKLEIIITSLESGKSQLLIYNIYGQITNSLDLYFSQPNQTSSLKFDCSHLTNGFYQVIFKSDSYLTKCKFIKW